MSSATPLWAGFLIGNLESVIAACLSASPDRQALLERIAGKAASVRWLPFGFTVHLHATHHYVQVRGDSAQPSDARISGTLAAFARRRVFHAAKLQSEPTGLTLEGDAEVARAFLDLIDHLTIDWETLLRGLPGAGLGAYAGNALYPLLAWSADAITKLRTDLAEYWQEETRELPSSAEAEQFAIDVTALAAELDHLTKRILRLEETLGAAVPPAR
jgi:ubiquinone biosynthesis protein UbiJ